jgi:hypothetical protein
VKEVETRDPKKGLRRVAEWEDGKGRIFADSALDGNWVDGEWKSMDREDWRTLLCIKITHKGEKESALGQKTSKDQFEQEEKECLARIREWQERQGIE